MRSNYTVVLNVTPTSPLVHGSGTAGNEQVLLRRPYMVQVEGSWETIYVPAVSGSALKATLREHAVVDYLERVGVPEGGVSRDVLRLLLKGGKNDSPGQSISLADQRRLRDLCPLLSIFGSMDGGSPMPGAIKVSDCTVWCEEVVEAGLLPRWVRPLSVVVDANDPIPEAIPIQAGRAPIPLAFASDRVVNYRHDLTLSGASRYLADGAREQIETAQEDVAEKRGKGGPKPTKEERREANESMPHSAQCIRPGVPMVAIIRLQGVTDVEFGAFGVALVRWIRSGGHLGGAGGKGHGACQVAVAGAIRHEVVRGETPVEGGEELPSLTQDLDPSVVALAYDAHIRGKAPAIRAWVTA